MNEYFASRQKFFDSALVILADPLIPEKEPHLLPEHQDTLVQISAHCQKKVPVSSALINLSKDVQNFVLTKLAKDLEQKVCLVNCKETPEDPSQRNKFLGRLFAEAEDNGLILFFDEADALFGKRSEVKDAHDRYANDDAGFLLRRVSEFNGLALFNFYDPKTVSSLASVFTYMVLNRRAVT